MSVIQLVGKKVLVVFFMCMVMALGTLQAQTDDDKYNFDDIPVDDVGLSYIGVGGGYLGQLAFMDFDALNTAVAVPMGLEEFEGQVLLSGGGGFAAVGIIPNVRLGVYGGGGTIERSGVIEYQGVNYNRTAKFSTSFTSAQIDYAIPVFSGFNIFPGIMLGGGSNTLEIVQTRDGGDSFGNIISPPLFEEEGMSNGNRYARISTGYLTWNAGLNLEYALTEFFMLRVGAGYTGSAFGDTWTDESGAEIMEVPDINSDGLALQFGVFLGLFQQ